MTNRKLFTAIFRYRNLSGFNNLRDSEAKQMLPPPADFIATRPYFFYASNLEEAKNLMQSVFFKLQKTKNLDVVALFIRELEGQEEKKIKDFVAISADDIALFIFNNDELGGYETEIHSRLLFK